VLEEIPVQVHQLISSLFYLCYNMGGFYYQQHLNHLQILQPSLKEKEFVRRWPGNDDSYIDMKMLLLRPC